MTEKFTKADLKAGMVVEAACGKRYIVIINGDEVHGFSVTEVHGWVDFKYFDNDLRSENSDFDIMVIFNPYTGCLLGVGRGGPDVPVWERPPDKAPKQLQIEELEATIAKAQRQIETLKLQFLA